MWIWLARILALAWAGFWLWFGVASGMQLHLSWPRVALYGWVGFVFLALALIAWFRPKLGAVLLVLTGFLLAGLHPIYYVEQPRNTKLFVLATFALPPLLSGLIQLLSGGSKPQTTSLRS